MADIFIRHMEKTAQVALEIAQGWEAGEYAIWYHERASIPSISYVVQTGRALEQLASVVLIVSVHSLSSDQARHEIMRARESGKLFIPMFSQVIHSQFQTRQPLWHQIVSSASSIAFLTQSFFLYSAL
nr:TIR domain-containing protein [Chloroflexota bacterium]